MQGQIVHRIPKDRFLDEKHIALCLLNLLNHVEEILALLFEDFIHLAVVVDDNLVFHLNPVSNFSRPKRESKQARNTHPVLADSVETESNLSEPFRSS